MHINTFLTVIKSAYTMFKKADNYVTNFISNALSFGYILIYNKQ